MTMNTISFKWPKFQWLTKWPIFKIESESISEAMRRYEKLELKKVQDACYNLLQDLLHNLEKVDPGGCYHRYTSFVQMIHHYCYANNYPIYFNQLNLQQAQAVEARIRRICDMARPFYNTTSRVTTTMITDEGYILKDTIEVVDNKPSDWHLIALDKLQQVAKANGPTTSEDPIIFDNEERTMVTCSHGAFHSFIPVLFLISKHFGSDNPKVRIQENYRGKIVIQCKDWKYFCEEFEKI